MLETQLPADAALCRCFIPLALIASDSLNRAPPDLLAERQHSSTIPTIAPLSVCASNGIVIKGACWEIMLKYASEVAEAAAKGRFVEVYLGAGPDAIMKFHGGTLYLLAFLRAEVHLLQFRIGCVSERPWQPVSGSSGAGNRVA